MTTYLAQTLIDQGYIGVTGSTPYKPATAGQITQLQNIYNQSFVGHEKAIQGGLPVARRL